MEAVHDGYSRVTFHRHGGVANLPSGKVGLGLRLETPA